MDFGRVYESCKQSYFLPFSIFNGFIFKNNGLCVSCCSLRLTILAKAHGGSLGGHFGREKTLALVQSNFYWLKCKRDVDRHVKQCLMCHLVKTISQKSGLYTPFPIPKAP